TDDDVFARGLCRETHGIGRFRYEAFSEPERERPRDRGSDGLRVERSLGGDDLRAVRQHAVVVAEVDLGPPPHGHHEREVAVPEPVEIERTVHPGESGNQLETDGLRGSVDTEPGRVDIRAGPYGGGETQGENYRRRVREPACRHESVLRVAT